MTNFEKENQAIQTDIAKQLKRMNSISKIKIALEVIKEGQKISTEHKGHVTENDRDAYLATIKSITDIAREL